MQIKTVLLLFTGLFITGIQCVKSGNMFTNIGVDRGLSRNTILDIEQDDKGMIWIATNGGLNRFDGYDVRIYRHDRQSERSIGSDNIHDLTKDRQGRIWAVTDAGLSVYNARTDSFDNYFYRGKALASAIPLDNEHLLVNAGGYLVNFSTSDLKFRRNGICNNYLPQVTSLYRCSNIIYIGTVKGVFRYDVSKHTLRLLASFGVPPQSMLQTSKSLLWVGTEGGGLYAVDIRTGKSQHVTFGNIASKTAFVRSLGADEQGRL